MTAPVRQTRAAQIAPEVARLVGEGLSRNAIARQLGCANGTVSAAAVVAGVSFDRSAPVAAIRAAQIDAKTAHAQLAVKFRERANAALDAIVMTNARDARDLMVVAGVAMDKSLRVSELDVAEKFGVPQVEEWLFAMTGKRSAA